MLAGLVSGQPNVMDIAAVYCFRRQTAIGMKFVTRLPSFVLASRWRLVSLLAAPGLCRQATTENMAFPDPITIFCYHHHILFYLIQKPMFFISCFLL